MTATSDTFDQILWLFRIDNPNTCQYLDNDFFDAIEEISSLKGVGMAKVYADTATKVFRDLKRERKPKSLMDHLRKTIATNLIASAAYRFAENQAPKLHHWIPICYLSRFTRGLQQHRSRGALIPMIDFSSPRRHSIVNDKEFAHRKGKDGGFFQLTAENFFAVIEARYENAASQLQYGIQPEFSQLVAFVAMLMVQHLRAPKNGNFQTSQLHEFARELVELMDSIDNGHAYVEFSEEAFLFTPNTPTRQRNFTDGGRAWHFPLSSNATLIFADRELTEAERARMAEGSRISAMKTAKRNGTPLYGALETDFV